MEIRTWRRLISDHLIYINKKCSLSYSKKALKSVYTQVLVYDNCPGEYQCKLHIFQKMCVFLNFMKMLSEHMFS